MRWYLNIDDKNYGPYEEAQILQMIQAGQVHNDWIAQEGGDWQAVDSHPPFAQALAARDGVPQPQPAGGGQMTQQPVNAGQPAYQSAPGPVAQGVQGQPGDDLDLLKTIPFQDAGQQLESMQNFDASMPQSSPYDQGQAAPPDQQVQAAPPAQQAQQAQAQPPPSQQDAGQAAPSDQITPPSIGKAVVLASIILAAIIGVGVLLQILIGPGF
jgi:hypothetical protein